MSLYFPLQAHIYIHGLEVSNQKTCTSMKAAFIPQVNTELDTHNFEKFKEVIFCCLYISRQYALIILPAPYTWMIFLVHDNWGNLARRNLGGRPPGPTDRRFGGGGMTSGAPESHQILHVDLAYM